MLLILTGDDAQLTLITYAAGMSIARPVNVRREGENLWSAL